MWEPSSDDTIFDIYKLNNAPVPIDYSPAPLGPQPMKKDRAHKKKVNKRRKANKAARTRRKKNKR